jgi:hypothetical protein
MEYLLARAVCDEDRVCDDVRDHLAEHLGDRGVLAVDETGDLNIRAKTGTPGTPRSPPAGHRATCTG